MVTPIKLPSKGFILAQDGGQIQEEQDDSVINEVVTRRESLNQTIIDS